MKFKKYLEEAIKIPIKVGDTVLGGKFKNKRIVVKDIGKNAKGDITINGRPLLKFRIIESALPPGFDGFGDDEITPAKTTTTKVDKNKLPNEVQRDSIVKVGSKKWLVYRRFSDYTAWVYKHPSKKRKGYELISIGNGKFEVWETSGSGNRVKDKPEITGKMTI